MLKYLHGLKSELGLQEYLALAGLTLVAIGVGAIYWPAALIVVGSTLLYLAFMGVKRGLSG